MELYSYKGVSYNMTIAIMCKPVWEVLLPAAAGAT